MGIAAIKEFLEPDRLKALNNARKDERKKAEDKYKFVMEIELAKINTTWKIIVHEKDSEIKSLNARVEELEADKREFQDRKDKFLEMVVDHRLFMTDLYTRAEAWLKDQSDKARTFYQLKDRIEEIERVVKKINRVDAIEG